MEDGKEASVHVSTKVIGLGNHVRDHSADGLPG
jgi:hypothetical protein